MTYFYMSFCDPDKPKGSKFLGALVIQGSDFDQALKKSWRLDLNPGGEIMFFEVPKSFEHRVTPDLVNRLLTKEEVEEIDLRYTGDPS